MRSQKFWKNPIKYFLFAVFLFAGCSTYTTNVRPSFDENYKKKIKSANSPSRPSKKQKATERHTQPQKEIEDERENTEEFEVEPQETEETTGKINSGNGEFQKAAEKYLGSPYHYGGTTKRGFDCSGFVWRVYQDVGHTEFSRQTAQAMFDKGKPVSQNSIREGDLIFFYSPRSRKKIDHTGIYIGDKKFIHSASTLGVAYSKLDDAYWKNHFAGFRRLLD